ncbi:hypothetical protein BDW69DRAFT_7547 [Aspergillus filifer]
MARRAHRKSRNGCLECKRRHVKCDERRPTCSNCISSERECEYGNCIISAAPSGRRPFPRSRSAGPGPTSTMRLSDSPRHRTGTPTSVPSQAASPFQAQAQSQVYSPAPTPTPFPGASEDAPANMLHVTLLQNLFTKTHLTFDPTGSLPWLSTVFASPVIATPYFVNELLAFSALHMSILANNQREREYYHYHAAQLQTHALSLFKDAGLYGGGGGEVSQDSGSAIPLFLFASVLGVHMLCDTLIYHTADDDFEAFLSRFTHYLRLHSGVRAVLRSSWASLTSDTCIIKPALDIGMKLYKFEGPLEPHFKYLLERICASNLGSELERVYRQAIETLQSCAEVASAKYEHPRADPDPEQRAGESLSHAGINGLIAWPIMVEEPFIETLEERRPEGLVILAHYAVLVHDYRLSWIFGGSGRWIIEQIRRRLEREYGANEWDGWMEWPGRVLMESAV